MKTTNKYIASALLLTLLALNGCTTKKTPVDYVNPYMGNISHLLVPTYPTVHLPNAMMRVYPERADYTSDKINGLPLIVTSHRGKSAFNLSFVDRAEQAVKPSYKYHYDNEVVKPYFYSVYLDDEEVEVSFAPSFHSAVYRLDFVDGRTPSLVINTDNGDVLARGNSVEGFQSLNAQTKVYIYAEFSEQPVGSQYFENGLGNYVVLQFAEGTGSIGVRYGVSFIDTRQARENLQSEITTFDVDAVAKKGRAIWNDKLSRINVEGIDEDAKTVFYTSLYRTYERMICLSEGERYFSAFDAKVHQDERPFYTDDWIWDTYRAVHPLRVIIEPKEEGDMIASFLRMAEQMENKWMPTFPEVTGDSRRMNSNHGVATVADACCKGLQGFDLQTAYNYCKAGITEKTLAPWSGVKGGGLTDFYWQNGYIPALKEGERETFDEVHGFERRQPIAVTLGTSYDEWCLSQIARRLGNDDDYSRFSAGSFNYRNVFNPTTRFFHPKDADGKFILPFDYARSGGIGARNTYGENNGWVYRWDVQHNIADLIELYGGKQQFVNELDRMFSAPLGSSKYEFYSQLPDHTGNVGQFSMANEPSLHVPYLYVYAGCPWKTQKCVRKLLHEWFRNDLMGVPGDEDGGGMSAFVVFSMLGFYPVTPGLPMYVIGSPQFERATVELDGGKHFEILCHNYSPANKYIQSAKLNGVTLDRSWFTHDELAAGGKLEFVMGDRPNKLWASESVPPSFSMNN